MPSTTRSRTHPKKESSFAALVSGWAQQGAESFLATQHILLNLAVRQNANVMRLLREQFTDPRRSPVKVLSEFTGEGITNFIEAQKVLLDLAQQQNKIVMTGVKERVGVSALGNLLHRSVENFIEMQQEFLKLAGRQTHTWLEAAKAGKPVPGRQWIETAREAMENFIHAQKKFLDVVAEEARKATVDKRDGHPQKKIKKTELSELARQAVDSFIEAERKLFAVAGRQINANVRVAGETAALVRPFSSIPLADLTREGVKSYVDASKALIDVMRKGRDGHNREPKKHSRGKRPPVHVKAETAQTAVA